MSGVRTSSLSLPSSLRNWVILDYEEANGLTIRPWAPVFSCQLFSLLIIHTRRRPARSPHFTRRGETGSAGYGKWSESWTERKERQTRNRPPITRLLPSLLSGLYSSLHHLRPFSLSPPLVSSGALSLFVCFPRFVRLFVPLSILASQTPSGSDRTGWVERVTRELISCSYFLGIHMPVNPCNRMYRDNKMM